MHNQNCECAICKLTKKGLSEKQAMSVINEKTELFLQQYGFYCHHVMYNDFIDTHTHGLKEIKHHIDLQIALPLAPKQALDIMHFAVDFINKGKVFKEDEIFFGLLQDDFPVTFKKYKQKNREVLRILLCDENGILPNQPNCDINYVKQLYYDTM